MSVKDLANQIVCKITAFTNINADGEFPQQSIDTADFGEGIATFCNFGGLPGFGTYVLTYDESEDDGDSDPWTRVPDEKLIIPPNTSPLTDPTQPGTFLPRVGVFANKRWIRPVIIATNVTTGTNAACITVLQGEYLPIPNQ